MNSCSYLCNISLYFRTIAAVASLLLLGLADAILYEKPYNIARFRLFPEFLSIESDVIKLDTA